MIRKLIGILILLVVPVAVALANSTSTTDGVRFPDGTTQTTAGSGTGWARVGTAVSPSTITDNVGIGTTVAAFNLSIQTSANNQIRAISTAASGAASGSNLAIYNDDGAAIASGDRVSLICMGGAKDAAHSLVNSACLAAFATENWGTNAAGTDFEIQNVTAGTTSRTSKVYVVGTNVGIGSSNPGKALDLGTTGNIRVINQKSSSGTRYLCIDTNGDISSSASACSGT